MNGLSGSLIGITFLRVFGSFRVDALASEIPEFISSWRETGLAPVKAAG
jgi:hypothetical protein